MKRKIMNSITNVAKIMLAVLLLHNCGGIASTAPTDTEHVLVGTWEMTQITMQLLSDEYPTVTTANDDFNGTLIINSDSTINISFVSFGAADSAEGTWSVDDGNIFNCEVDEYPYLSGVYVTLDQGNGLIITSSSTPEDYNFIQSISFQRQ